MIVVDPAELHSIKLLCTCSGTPKTVSPLICRTCQYRFTCKAVQELLTSEKALRQYKGTMLESGLRHVTKLKKEVAHFILE